MNMKYSRAWICVFRQNSGIKLVTKIGTAKSNRNFGTKTHMLLENLYKDSGIKIPIPCPNLSYLLGKTNHSRIVENLSKRNEITIEQASKLVEELHEKKQEVMKEPTEKNRNELVDIAIRFPNSTHPKVVQLQEPLIVKEVKWKPKSPLQLVRTFERLGSLNGGLRTHDTSQVASERSYYLFGQIAELEQALIR